MTRHSPGEWFGVVTPAGVALLPDTVPVDTVEQVWLALRECQGLSAVIDGLVGAFGTSLSSLPAFAVLALSENDAVRVAVRGEARALLWPVGDEQPVIVSGLEVTTWNERVVPGVGRAEIALPSATGEALLPVVDGVVRTGQLVVPVLAEDSAGSTGTSAAQDPAAAVRVLPRLAAAPPLLEPVTESPEEPGPVGTPVPVQPEPEASADVTLPQVRPVAEPEPAEPVEAAPAPEAPANSAAPDDRVASRPANARRSAETMVGPVVPNEYDELLFGETVLSSAEAAAVRDDEPELGATTGMPPVRAVTPTLDSPSRRPQPPTTGMITAAPVFTPDGARHAAEPPSAPLGDHDGETVLVEQLHLPTGGMAGVFAPATEVPPRRVPRLVIADRAPVALERTAIVGTRPRAARVQGDSMPHLVPVESPNGEISRSHVELRVEGGTVLAVDLNSTNGTMLLRLGNDPVRLQPGEPSILVAGDTIDLGDGVLLGFEGLE